MTSERADVVAWLRGPVWPRMSPLKRMHFAIGMLFAPEKVGAAFARNFANRIERGEHKETNDAN